MIASKASVRNVKFEEYVNVAHHAEISNATIGKRTSVGRYTKIQFAQIGRYCSISWDVTIGALDHPLNAVSMHAFSYRKQFGLCKDDIMLEHEIVSIGNDVWIGCGAIIMPGVHIGDGAVIGAGALVTHDVAPYEIVAGVPARHLNNRFDKEIIETLKEIKWWDLMDEDIIKNIDLFSPFINLTTDTDVLTKLKNICTKDISLD